MRLCGFEPGSARYKDEHVAGGLLSLHAELAVLSVHAAPQTILPVGGYFMRFGAGVGTELAPSFLADAAPEDAWCQSLPDNSRWEDLPGEGQVSVGEWLPPALKEGDRAEWGIPPVPAAFARPLPAKGPVEVRLRMHSIRLHIQEAPPRAPPPYALATSDGVAQADAAATASALCSTRLQRLEAHLKVGDGTTSVCDASLLGISVVGRAKRGDEYEQELLSMMVEEPVSERESGSSPAGECAGAGATAPIAGAAASIAEESAEHAAWERRPSTASEAPPTEGAGSGVHDELNVTERGAELMRAQSVQFAVEGDAPVLVVDVAHSYHAGGTMRLAGTVRLRRLRVVAMAALLGRSLAWVLALAKGNTLNVDDVAASELVNESSAPPLPSSGEEVRTPPMRIKLVLDLALPLIVVPSPKLACAAVLVAAGDFHLTADLTAPESESDAPPQLHELLARLSNVQVLVAPPQLHWRRGESDAFRSSRLLTEHWLLKRKARPHWLLPQMGLTLTATQTVAEELMPTSHLVMGSTRDPVRDLTPVDEDGLDAESDDLDAESDDAPATAPPWPPVRPPAAAASIERKRVDVLLELSTSTVSFAVNEAAFLHALVDEVVALLFIGLSDSKVGAGAGAGAGGGAGGGGGAARHAAPAGAVVATQKRAPTAMRPGIMDADASTATRPPSPVDAAGGRQAQASVDASVREGDADDFEFEERSLLSPTLAKPQTDQADRPASRLPYVRVELKCDGGIWVRLVDDVEDALMPLYEVGVQHLSADVEGTLGESDEVGDQGADDVVITFVDGQAKFALMVEASHFNENNGYWEPLVEQWYLNGKWESAAAHSKRMRERRTSRASAGSGSRRESVDDVGAPDDGPPVHRFSLTAAYVLNINVTHAMLASLIEVQRIVQAANLRQAQQWERQQQAQRLEARRKRKAAEAASAVGFAMGTLASLGADGPLRSASPLGQLRSASPHAQLRTESPPMPQLNVIARQTSDDSVFDSCSSMSRPAALSTFSSSTGMLEEAPEMDDDSDGETEIKFMPYAVCNSTELMLRFESTSTATAGRKDVRPGTTVAFETPGQAAAQRRAEVQGGPMPEGRIKPDSDGTPAEAVTSNCEELVTQAR